MNRFSYFTFKNSKSQFLNALLDYEQKNKKIICKVDKL